MKNICNESARKVYLSKLAGMPLMTYLEKQGYQLHLLTGEASPVYDAVSTHADIHMCQLGLWEHPQLFMGNPDMLSSHYPGNIIYNAVCTGQYFIHNLHHTDPALLQAAESWHETCFPHLPFTKVHVSQGYTRCCCLPVNDRSFITSDEGIAKALAFEDADVLLIEKGHILLPGFDYGFIGGCAGILPAERPKDGCADSTFLHTPASDHMIVFNGDLSAHPDYEKIAAFLKNRDIELLYFKEYPLTDIGSILTGGAFQTSAF